MLKLNNREKKIIVGAAIILAIVAVYFFFLGPFLIVRSELKDKLDYSYHLFKEYDAILAYETSYQEQLKGRRKEMRTVAKLLLSGNTSSLAAAELSNKIRAFADDAGISITRENVNQPVIIEQYQQISIQLNMSCDVIGLHDFLKKIEDDSNLLTINSLEANSPSNIRRSYRKGRQPVKKKSEPENLRVTLTIAGFIEGNGGQAGEEL
jgi:type II secretory pathway component PulM